MTRKHFKKIKNSLESINKISLEVENSESKDNKYKVEYKHTIVDLDDYSLIVSGSAQQYYQHHHSREEIYLFISFFDAEHNEIKPTVKQHTKLRKLVNIKTAV